MQPVVETAYGFILGGVTTLALWLVLMDNGDLRRFSSAMGVAVFGLILWRVIGSWDLLTQLERVLSVLLAISPLVSALATVMLIHRADTLPDNPLLWGVLAHRGACIVMVIWWNAWLHADQRTMKRRRSAAG